MTTRNPGVTLRGDRNECPGCNELFNSTYAFDKHRIGKFGDGPKGSSPERRCMTPDEMLQRGMVKRSDGFWVGSLRDENAISSLPRDAGNDFPVETVDG